MIDDEIEIHAPVQCLSDDIKWGAGLDAEWWAVREGFDHGTQL